MQHLISDHIALFATLSNRTNCPESTLIIAGFGDDAFRIAHYARLDRRAFMKEEIIKRLREDFDRFIEKLRKEVQELDAGHRKAIYAVAEQAATAVHHLMKHDAAFDSFVQRPYFLGSRKKITSPGAAVFLYIDDAKGKNSRERCSRLGRAVEKLLSDGVAPDEIAEQLSQQGGIMAVLDQRAKSGQSECNDDSSASASADEDNDEHEDNGSSRRSRTKLETPALLPGWSWFYLKVRDEDMEAFIEPGNHTASFEVTAGPKFQTAVAVSLDDQDLIGDDE